MDFGSLELQILVSLTVVLGGAFVALVCGFLKGSNEQLRGHNIELRVRKEEQEQERKLLLDPAGFVGQWLPGSNLAGRAAIPSTNHAGVRTVSAHEVMQSFAAPEALMEAETRAARLPGRGGGGYFDSAAAPPLTKRRAGRYRAARKRRQAARSNGESYADWVRPEVIARVARESEAAAACGSGIRDDLEAAKVGVRSEPQNAVENRDIRGQNAVREKLSGPTYEKTAVRHAPPVEPLIEIEQETEAIAGEPRMHSEEASRFQQEAERVVLFEYLPVAPASGTILRPLTVPSLKLQEEIERVAERPPAGAPRVQAVFEAEWIESAAVTPAEVELPVVNLPSGERAAEVTVAETRYDDKEITVATEVATSGEVTAEGEPELEPVAAIAMPVKEEQPSYWPEHLPSVIEAEIEEPALVASLFNYSEFGLQHSRLAGMGLSLSDGYLTTPPVIEKPTAVLSLSEEPAFVSTEPPIFVENDTDSLPRLLPLYSEMSWEPAAALEKVTAFGTSNTEPLSIWKTPRSAPPGQPAALILPAPIDISAARQPDPAPVSRAPVVTTPDLLLPTGMHWPFHLEQTPFTAKSDDGHSVCDYAAIRREPHYS